MYLYSFARSLVNKLEGKHIMKNKDKYLQLIKSNIEECGYHIYGVVDSGPLPRFFYSIGLSEKIGIELMLA